MIIRTPSVEQINEIKQQIAEAKKAEEVDNEYAEYQAAAYQRGRYNALEEILVMLIGEGN